MVAPAPAAVGPCQRAAGQGIPPLVRLSPTAARARGEAPAVSGVLVPATAWARTPGPVVLPVPGLTPAADCNRGRHTCGRSARLRTTKPAGNRVVRSGPCRYQRASDRTPGRCVRPRTTRDAGARGASCLAGGGDRAAGTAAWACPPPPARSGLVPCPDPRPSPRTTGAGRGGCVRCV